MAEKPSKDCQRKSHFTFIWTVENASALLVSGVVESPRFIVNSLKKTKWNICICAITCSKSLNLQICRQKDNGPNSIEVECEISILMGDGSPFGMQTFLKQFQGITKHELIMFKNCSESSLKRRAYFQANDTLTVRCRMWSMRTEISKADTCFARTRLGMNRHCFVWAIKEFSSLQQGQKRTHIVNRTTLGSPQMILNLFLNEKNGKNYLNIQLFQNVFAKRHYIFSKFSLLDSDGKVVHFGETIVSIDGILKKEHTFADFFEKDKLMTDECSLLQNDVLYLKCELQIQADPVWSRIDSYGCSNLEDLEQIKNEMLLDEPDESCTVSYSLKKAFEDLYADDSLSDVSLRSGTTSFPAHKAILSVRSPVFKAMFTQDMREKSSKVVDIPDFNADTLNRLLLYIYKDTVKDLEWQSAMELFRAADMYQLLDLRKKCSLFLKSNLSVANVCSILSLADMHEEEYLRKAAEYYVSQYDIEVFKSEAWKNFKEENYRLAVELMERIIHLIHLKYESS